MPDLSPIAAEVLAELHPVLADLARMRAGTGETTWTEQGTVTGVDRVTGRATVKLDSALLGSADADAKCFGSVPAPRERVWVQLLPGVGPVIVSRFRGQPGLLGWGQAVADVGVSEVAGVTICTAVAPVQADRVLRISAHIGQVLDTTGFDQSASAWVADSGVFLATIARREFPGFGSEDLSGHVELFAPVAGYHSYELVVGMTNGPGTGDPSGTVLAQPLGTTPGPATLVVEDLGSSNTAV